MSLYIDEQKFREIVSDDVKNKLTEEDKKQLRLPENAKYWFDELVLIKKTVEARLTQNTAAFELQRLDKENVSHNIWIDQQKMFQSWKLKTARFLQAVEVRIQEARNLLRTIGGTYRQHGSFIQDAKLVLTNLAEMLADDWFFDSAAAVNNTRTRMLGIIDDFRLKYESVLGNTNESRSNI